jgi:tetratricopeptide (TPR) repeat protein
LGGDQEAHSAGSPATVAIAGFRGEDLMQPVSSGQVRIETSGDPAGAPIFYRDVPLMPNQGNKGVITPLAPQAIGLIKWRLRYLDEPKSRVVMEKISTCANCHSFSADGKTLGLDVDGPAERPRSVRADPGGQGDGDSHAGCDQVAYRPRSRHPPAASRFHVAGLAGWTLRCCRRSTIGTPPHASPRDARSKTSITWPTSWTTGSCKCSIRRAGRWPGTIARPIGLQRLPGADDPRYVQAGGVWSPDGKYIVFMRAQAQTPYPPGVPLALYANDPKETQIQYDLYRIPFNQGEGGQPERLRGASGNGMSNSFPKVSPDGRWIVFVQARNGMVMRPDGKLYIVPAEGGEARLMKCNTPLMNSWHTFSPNGRWMAFSSKSRSPYTQLYLTHVDSNGNDTPPILVDNTTAANRAVNLPEFANIPKGGLEKIDPVANQYYKLETSAIELMTRKQFSEAIPVWRNALEKDPSEGRAHLNLAYALIQTGQPREALAEYRKACDLSPEDPLAFAESALAMAQAGAPEEAISYYRKSLALDASNAGVQADLGALLSEKGAAAEGIEHLEKAVALKPESAAVRYKYATALAQAGRFPDAVEQFRKSIEISGGKDWQSFDMLGSVYSRMGRSEDAAQAERKALELAPVEDGVTLRAKLASYEQGQRR